MEYACYAAHEMMWKYRPYLWKRLFVTSAEDCYDPVTARILYLRKKDFEIYAPGDTKYLSEAINLLVRTRKNRDADFFACNYVCSKDKREDLPMGSGPLVTRHGHDLKGMARLLKIAILNHAEEDIGYISCEIWCWYKKLFWIVAKSVAKELGSGVVAREIEALQTVDMSYNQDNKTFIFIGKAVVLLLHIIKEGTHEIFSYPDMRAIEDVLKYSNPRNIPEYTYDCHTIKGKAMGKTVFDFRVSEQISLRPHIQGEYDDRQWDNSTKWNADGRCVDCNTPKLPRQLLDDANNGIFPSTLFD